MEEEIKNPWESMTGFYVSYNSKIDLDAINVLKLIRIGKLNMEISKELNLSEEYVELLQCLFSSADSEIFDYGSSPRGLWMNIYTEELAKKCDEYILMWENFFTNKWGMTTDQLNNQLKGIV